MITQASVLDADAILHVNRVNKRYSNDVPYTAEDYRAALNTKNEFFLIARRGVGSYRGGGKHGSKHGSKQGLCFTWSNALISVSLGVLSQAPPVHRQRWGW